MAILSNNSKAILFNDNLLEAEYVQRSQCYIIQHYDFSLNRSRDITGQPYDFDGGNTLMLSLRIGSTQNLTPFYQMLKNERMTAFSIVFNATFDYVNMLGDYDSAIVIEGYVVDISENIVRQGVNDQSPDTIQMSILMKNVNYVSEQDQRNSNQYVNSMAMNLQSL